MRQSRAKNINVAYRGDEHDDGERYGIENLRARARIIFENLSMSFNSRCPILNVCNRAIDVLVQSTEVDGELKDKEVEANVTEAKHPAFAGVFDKCRAESYASQEAERCALQPDLAPQGGRTTS